MNNVRQFTSNRRIVPMAGESNEFPGHVFDRPFFRWWQSGFPEERKWLGGVTSKGRASEVANNYCFSTNQIGSKPFPSATYFSVIHIPARKRANRLNKPARRSGGRTDQRERPTTSHAKVEVVKCAQCRGTSRVEGLSCLSCDGRGVFTVYAPSTVCPNCTGTGKTGHRVVQVWRSRWGLLGIRTDVSDYGLNDPLQCPFDQTIKLANIPTRLARLDSAAQDRLINWGYAVCDAAVPRHVNQQLPLPIGFPYRFWSWLIKQTNSNARWISDGVWLGRVLRRNVHVLFLPYSGLMAVTSRGQRHSRLPCRQSE